jgi:hypothetical protein
MNTPTHYLPITYPSPTKLSYTAFMPLILQHYTPLDCHCFCKRLAEIGF